MSDYLAAISAHLDREPCRCVATGAVTLGTRPSEDAVGTCSAIRSLGMGATCCQQHKAPADAWKSWPLRMADLCEPDERPGSRARGRSGGPPMLRDVSQETGSMKRAKRWLTEIREAKPDIEPDTYMRGLEHATTCADCEIRENNDPEFCEVAEAIMWPDDEDDE